MDLATHALAGMAVGAAAGRWVSPASALAAGGAGAVLPDLDAFLWLIDLRLYYEWHRVLTHTVVTLPATAAAAAMVGMAISRTRAAQALTVGVTMPVRMSALLFVATLSLLLHLSLDLVCDFPLRLLWPFSRHDFALYLIGYSHPAFAVGFAALALILIYPLARPRGDVGL